MKDYGFTIESKINCTQAALWKHVTQMKNVNYELMPYACMTYPKDRTEVASEDVPMNTVLMKSVVLLFGFIPIDLHSLKLDKIVYGEAFYENSTTLMHRYWKHTRTLTSDGEFTLVKDEVRFLPRLAFLGPALLPLMRTIFKNRHKKLKQFYN